MLLSNRDVFFNKNDLIKSKHKKAKLLTIAEEISFEDSRDKAKLSKTEENSFEDSCSTSFSKQK